MASREHPVLTLRSNIESCTACTIRPDALMPVPFEGNIRSKLMIVGRNPGRDENAGGRPFIGRGGRCLDHMLAVVGIDRNQVMITNMAKCYTQGDRPPTDDEYRTCVASHLLKEIEVFQPQLIIALGNDVFRHLVGGQSVIKQRQQFFPFKSKHVQIYGCEVTGILHPGSAVRDPKYWAMMEEDFKWLVTTPQFSSAYNPF
jgi:uracil-DNA glycosylase family 4